MKRRIIVTLIVKNESKNIEQCLASVEPIADAIVICDTGSTDNTREIIMQYKAPVALFNDTWIDITTNRNLSFDHTRNFCESILEWPLDTTYMLSMNADMLLVSAEFDKDTLVAEGYSVILNNNFKNSQVLSTRLLRLNFPWRCNGAAQWDAPATPKALNEFMNSLCIESFSLVDNDEYIHMLSIRDQIAMYRKRVRAKGWIEERWYSMYQISRLYAQLKKFPKMEMWALKAFELIPERSENIYFLTKTFRECLKHHKAWHYMQQGICIQKPTSLHLHLENDVYSHLFKYEKTILNYYVQPQSLEDNLRYLVAFCNDHGNELSYHNLQHYALVVQLCQPSYQLNIPAAAIPPNYTLSSTSFVRKGDYYLLNVRLVNYRIDRSYGNYIILDESEPEAAINTRNFSCRLLAQSLPEPVTDWVDCDLDVKPACEKNWIFLDQDVVIYNWFPYSVGKIVRDRVLENVSNFQTPKLFKKVKSSTNFVAYGGGFIGIVHLAQNCLVRRYMHMVVFLSPDGKAIEHYSLPFVFFKMQMESVLSIDVCGDSIVTCVSQYDSLPTWVRIPISTLSMFC